MVWKDHEEFFSTLRETPNCYKAMALTQDVNKCETNVEIGKKNFLGMYDVA